MRQELDDGKILLRLAHLYQVLFFFTAILKHLKGSLNYISSTLFYLKILVVYDFVFCLSINDMFSCI